jgi:hypothetical protein
MIRRRFLALSGLLLISAAAQATTLLRMDLDQLTTAAGAVARVRCIENESRVEGGEIWTFTRFEVTEVLKGTLAPQINVRLIGGRVGSLVSTVEGVPRFQPGEEAFLFLEATRAGDLSVTSWAQGTFRVRRAEDATERVTQDTSGLSIFDPATRKFRPGGVRNLPIEEFRQRVREAIERHGRRQP